MKVYTVHLRRQGVNADKDFVLVRDGFSWGAFFFGPVWALWQGLVREALCIFAVLVVLSIIMPLLGFGPNGFIIAAISYAFMIGFMADDLKRQGLEREGMSAEAVVIGASEDEAAKRFLDANPSFAKELLV